MKQTDKEKLIAMNVLLPKKMLTALDAQAVREGVQSRAALIRRACAEYLARQSQGINLIKP